MFPENGVLLFAFVLQEVVVIGDDSDKAAGGVGEEESIRNPPFLSAGGRAITNRASIFERHNMSNIEAEAMARIILCRNRALLY